MPLNPWQIPQQMPQPTNYQPDMAAFGELLANLGGFQNSGPSQGQPSPTTPAPLPDPGVTSPTPETPGNFQPNSPGGPFGDVGLPTNNQDPSSWDFWGGDAEALKPLTNFLSIMSPYLTQLQGNYESQRDFTEGQNRYQNEDEWNKYLDLWGQGLGERQQNVAENDRETQLQQWLASFQRQGENDQFSQQMSIQQLMEQQRGNNLNAFGRGLAPARFSASWG